MDSFNKIRCVLVLQPGRTGLVFMPFYLIDYRFNVEISTQTLPGRVIEEQPKYNRVDCSEYRLVNQ